MLNDVLIKTKSGLPTYLLGQSNTLMTECALREKKEVNFIRSRLLDVFDFGHES